MVHLRRGRVRDVLRTFDLFDGRAAPGKPMQGGERSDELFGKAFAHVFVECRVAVMRPGYRRFAANKLADEDGGAEGVALVRMPIDLGNRPAAAVKRAQ